MKTTTAIQKSRSVEQYIKWSDEKELDIDARDMSIEFFTFHITTSQKDIFSALIEDIEIAKEKEIFTKESNNSIRQHGEVVNKKNEHNQGMTKAQDIIRSLIKEI